MQACGRVSLFFSSIHRRMKNTFVSSPSWSLSSSCCCCNHFNTFFHFFPSNWRDSKLLSWVASRDNDAHSKEFYSQSTSRQSIGYYICEKRICPRILRAVKSLLCFESAGVYLTLLFLSIHHRLLNRRRDVCVVFFIEPSRVWFSSSNGSRCRRIHFEAQKISGKR